MQPRAGAAGQNDSAHGLAVSARAHRRDRPLTAAYSSTWRLLVTGGAGFIGANFVHHVRASTPTSQSRSSMPSPMRAIGRRWTGVADRIEFVHGDIADAALVDGLVARVRRGRAFRRGVAQRQLAGRSVAVHPHQHHRHLHACCRRSRRTTSATTTSPPTRSTATSSSTTRRGSPRTRLQPVEPVLLDEGRQRPAGAGVGALLRHRGDDLELLQQLRARTSTSRSSSRARSPTCSTASGPSCTATALNVRDWIHVDDHNRGGAGRSSSAGGSARPT